MPRLTNHDYLLHHHSLMKLWQLAPLRFSFLSYLDQLLLHEYFQTQDDLSDAELLQCRAELTAQSHLCHSQPDGPSRVCSPLSDRPRRRARSLSSARLVPSPTWSAWLGPSSSWLASTLS